MRAPNMNWITGTSETSAEEFVIFTILVVGSLWFGCIVVSIRTSGELIFEE